MSAKNIVFDFHLTSKQTVLGSVDSEDTVADIVVVKNAVLDMCKIQRVGNDEKEISIKGI